MNPSPTPPRWARKFLSWFCREDLADAILGDLEELYGRHYEKSGKRIANLKYIFNIFLFLRPFAFKKSNILNFYSKTMYRHHFKIAWRNIAKHKMYSAIKIGGFSIGIAACLLIALFVNDEMSGDHSFKESDRLYRFVGVSSEPGRSGKWPSFPAPIRQTLANDFPEIEKTGRLIPYSGWFDAGDNQFRPEEKTQNLYEDGFVYADAEWLEIMQLPMVYGDVTTALAEPNTIVISREKADKYYPGENPVDKTVILNADEANPYKIGGVMEDLPENSHLQFDFILSLYEKEFWQGEQASWCCWNYDSYIKVKAGTDPRKLEEKLLLIRDNYIVPYSREEGDTGADDTQKYLSFILQPVKDIYLKSEGIIDSMQHSDIRIVWLFAAIAIFILLLACINFINLSTAKSANRAKEVGLRKVIGSQRSDLFRQFMTESILFSLISFVLGIILAQYFLPPFNKLANKSLIIPWDQWWLLPLMAVTMLGVGIFSGMYPSFYLSAFKPIDVIRGAISRGSKSSRMRSILVVFQFTTSIVLIICTIITWQQMNFILNKEIGFDKEQVIILEGASTLGSKYKSLKDALSKLSEVQHTTLSHALPVSGTNRDFNPFWLEGKTKEEKAVSAQKWTVDKDFIATMGIQLIEGRNFSEEIATDSQAVIISRTMAEKFGFDNPIGQRITNDFEPAYQVIGVIEDFHYEDMRRKIDPLCLIIGNGGSVASVKVKTDDMQATLATITHVWDEFMPNQPIRYSFLDQRYEKMYAHVERTGKVFSLFAILAIIVACLGLFALSAYMVEQRGKEISIRKVLGASLSQIFNLLTRDFLRLVAIALIIAIPIGWYLMNEWLADYNYRIDISWYVFALAGTLALLIALLTISSEALKAASADPANKLRSE